jgi:transcriptional regulator with XRE-family HTH domain
MLADPAVKAEYDRLNASEEFLLLDLVLAARQTAGLTQAQVAERMGTKAPAVARLESSLVSGKHSPTLATLRKYVEACGKKLELRVV